MLYTCSPNCSDPTHQHGTGATARVRSAGLGKSSDTARSATAPKQGTPVVDVHCHYLNSEVKALTEDLEPKKHDFSEIFANDLTRQTNVLQMQDRARKLSGVDERLEDMDRMGVDIQAISPAPFQYFYFVEPDRGALIARQVNEGIAKLVADTPKRFIGLGSAPLQNAELAIQELEYAVGTLGLRGLEINTNVNGLDLTDCQLGLEPFFARANELGAVLFLHPLGFSQGQRLTNHYFNNVIGNPLDTTVAISHLIFNGVVARYPKIKFIAAHGGGYVSHYWARMDHAWRARADCRTVIQRRPSDYLKHFYVDTMVFDPAMIKHLVDLFGADRVMLGTDYPYDMGEENPRQLIASVTGLSEDEVMRIEGLNAIELLNIETV
jgi:aminocarboxymuconate-semialdehyde decarboxylase